MGRAPAVGPTIAPSPHKNHLDKAARRANLKSCKTAQRYIGLSFGSVRISTILCRLVGIAPDFLIKRTQVQILA